MANPVLVYVGTYVGGGGVAQSGNITFSFAMTSDFEANVPVVITCPGTNTLSAGGEVTVYRSADKGAAWETVGTLAIAFPRPSSASQVQRQTFNLGPGYYLVSVQVGGGQASTWTAQMLTAEVLTAYA